MPRFAQSGQVRGGDDITPILKFAEDELGIPASVGDQRPSRRRIAKMAKLGFGSKPTTTTSRADSICFCAYGDERL